MSAYANIAVAGGDTAMPLSMRKRLALIAQHVAPGADTHLLDCGCGRGGYVHGLRQELGINAVGVEYLADKVAQAKADAAVAPYVEQGDIAALQFADNQFDAVLLNEVIEHVPDEQRSLREIHRVLKPGGKLILFAPNRRYPFETHGSHLRGGRTAVPAWVPLIPYFPLWLSRWFLQFWARNYWPGELRRLVQSAGFKILHVDYIWQTFEGISGRQLRVITRFKEFFRATANWCERSFLRSFGVSQVLICQK